MLSCFPEQLNPSQVNLSCQQKTSPRLRSLRCHQTAGPAVHAVQQRLFISLPATPSILQPAQPLGHHARPTSVLEAAKGAICGCKNQHAHLRANHGQLMACQRTLLHIDTTAWTTQCKVVDRELCATKVIAKASISMTYANPLKNTNYICCIWEVIWLTPTGPFRILTELGMT